MSLLDLLGLNRIFQGGVEVRPTRKILNFIGPSVSVVDNPADNRTDITIAADDSGPGAGVTGPDVSTPGHLALWDDSEGDELSDGPALASLATASALGAVASDLSALTDVVSDHEDRITDLESAPPGGGDTAFYGYCGHTTDPIGSMPSSWTDAVSGLSLTSGWSDDLQVGVTRSGSSFTFASAGYYRIHAFINQGGQSAFLAYRWRRGSATIASRVVYTSADGSNYHHAPTGWEAIVQVSAADVLTLQVSRQGGAGPTSWGSPGTPNPVDGETAWTGEITINRVGT